jgi:hypothetical protein
VGLPPRRRGSCFQFLGTNRTPPPLKPSRARNTRPICEGVGRKEQKVALERGGKRPEGLVVQGIERVNEKIGFSGTFKGARKAGDTMLALKDYAGFSSKLHQPKASERLSPEIALDGEEMDPLRLALALGKALGLCSQLFVFELCKEIAIVEASLEQQPSSATVK